MFEEFEPPLRKQDIYTPPGMTHEEYGNMLAVGMVLSLLFSRVRKEASC